MSVRVTTMSNADLIAAARAFGSHSALETELVKRLDVFVQEEIRKQERTEKFLSRANAQTDPEVRKIVDWARARA